ncbi:TPA: hypothetical protein OKV73_004631 [Escherichia albertii]|uniref:hypothetical protein n=1 Tax=Escherichia albertii TaxID=208962 RepID=UPI000743E21B|nr:hypothetical protein [Escherichia albertii]HCQ4576759.1 hypothetical protein [Escherichia albertii]
MKKTTIASLIAFGIFSGYACAGDAGTGQVEFIGSVTATTCDVSAIPQGGAFNAKSAINLGSVKVGSSGEEKIFSIKANNPADEGCRSLSKTNTAVIKMSSGAFTPSGLGAVSGAASDAYVKLTSVGAKQDMTITSANKDNGVSFVSSKLINEGFQFKAALHGGQKKGDFRTATNFTIDYQ